MASRSTLRYGERAAKHAHPLAKKLFTIAERKKTNLVVSADLTTTKELLDIADKLGPHIAVFKTHIDIVEDFSPETIAGLQRLSTQHDFLIFEDRKFVDIGHTVQKQYHGGALCISEWAHLVNASVLAGDGIVEALAATGSSAGFPYRGDRGLLILAEMTTKGSLATGDYTAASIRSAQKHADFVVGFVATRALSSMLGQQDGASSDDFVVFTTGINRATKGDTLGQQYQTPESAVQRGADFIIAGRGIYATGDPAASARLYQEEGWNAYLARLG